MSFYFMQETLCPFQTCEGYVLAYTARRFAVKEFNLCWVPHTLDNNPKAERVALSSELLEVLMSKGRNEFDYVITSDESWFYFECRHAIVQAYHEMRFQKELNKKLTPKRV
jgi:hypothetical protein